MYKDIKILKDRITKQNKQIEELKTKLANMPKVENFDNNFNELEDFELEYIAEQIKEGCTSGRADNETKNIYWDLRVNVWKD